MDVIVCLTQAPNAEHCPIFLAIQPSIPAHQSGSLCVCVCVCVFCAASSHTMGESSGM